MTEKTQPTDADILRALKQSWPIRGAPIEMVQPTREQFIAFARAVLARWGAQPTPSSAAEFAASKSTLRSNET